MVSRNRTIAFVVGVAGFLGSHLAEELLKKGIQVIGVDDFSTGSKDNLENLVKEKDFHLINSSISDDFFSVEQNIRQFNLPRLDYAFFIAEDEKAPTLYSKGIINFLNIAKLLRDEKFLGEEESSEHSSSSNKKPPKLSSEQISSEKPKVVLVSSLNLYDKRIAKDFKGIKEAEVRFAKFIKYYKLNGRIVRLAAVYGPRMHFRENDPMIRLIQASLLDQLKEESTVLDFSTRSIYVADAVELIVKSALSGSTAEKIYDGALLEPIRAGDIKQILQDPMWFETQNLSVQKLPELPTPNLKRTIKELSWHPKTNPLKGIRDTIVYFKDHQVSVPELEKEQETETVIKKKWSFASMEEEESDELGSDEAIQAGGSKKEKSESDEKPKNGFWNFIKPKATLAIILLVIFFGLIFPIGSVVYGALNIRANLQSSRQAVERTDFESAQKSIRSAQDSL